MAKNPLFSTYRQGENPVTSSMLAVFERIDLSLLETLLGAAAGEAALQMVTFTNQPHCEGPSVPDARISASFSYWFEVKTERGTLTRKQLSDHLRFCLADDRDARLFAITPDAVEPVVVAELDDERLVWFNFQTLSDAVDAVLGDETNLLGERTEFLLRELQALLVEDGLLDTDGVVVVAARKAYGEYRAQGVYACQPGRSFREGLTHMGFYYEGAVQPEIAEIMHREDDVPFTQEEPSDAGQRATRRKRQLPLPSRGCWRPALATTDSRTSYSCCLHRTTRRPCGFNGRSSTIRRPSPGAPSRGLWASAT